ncbi:MAG: hypothetical protein GVY31_14720 [Alphaproteobacteria bacterium]|jgi:hypothetical protein|nr:hypothetical protein [Alphaproteobacteria bacterium]
MTDSRRPGGTLRRLWHRAPVLTLVAGGALVLALVFALRLFMAISHWNAAPTDPHLAGWMTPRFVAHSWDVPREVILDSLALAPDGPGRRITLEELAQARSTPLPRLLDQLQAAIDAHRAGLAP